MTYDETSEPHLVGIGLTPELFRLLEELARKYYHWLEAYLLVDAARGVKLSTSTTKARTRLATMVIELDSRMYQRVWGIR